MLTPGAVGPYVLARSARRAGAPPSRSDERAAGGPAGHFVTIARAVPQELRQRSARVVPVLMNETVRG
ncbi:hypothetical protein ACF08M_07065 [Streptomyces sp. NPDC015032]|uniref:hypothetical protein n=1 Tax=Streptomyces sp. NPDC015032 TaxID=3364937 RepID=UPI0037010399